MTEVWVPETFRERPYAREHFIKIVRWAQQHHGFYQKFHVDISKPLPVIKRAQIQQYNELFLNGHQSWHWQHMKPMKKLWKSIRL